MRKVFLVILAVVFALGANMVQAQTTLYVDDDDATCGGNSPCYATIQAAIDAASDDDTINVAAGTYTNDIWDSLLGIPAGYRITKRITLQGAQAGNDPAGSTDRGGESILVRTNGVPYSLYVSDITIDGFTFTSGGGSGGGRLIIADYADNVTIKNCIIRDISGTDPHGVYIYPGAQNALIEYNTFSSTAWEAIRCDGNALISNNTIKNIPSNKGIVLGNSSNAQVVDNVISNTFYEGIQAFASATITGNEISECYNGLQIRGNETSYTVTGNNIHNNQYHGIEIPNYSGEVVANFVISGNLLANNPYTGVKVGGNTDGSGYLINCNSITGNGIFGVESFTDEDVDATLNWWGDADGPSGEGPGNGDAVTTNVSFDPWLLLEGDCDGDGVDDADDLCPGTVVDEPSKRLGKNRWIWDGWDRGGWVTDEPRGRGPEKDFSMEDTLGCSCEQILEILEEKTGFEFNGHYKFGCSSSLLEDWISGMYYLETVGVPATSTGVDSQSELMDGVDYLLKATGVANAGDTIDFDAKYSITNRIPLDTWTDAVSDYESYGPTLLDLFVNGSSVDWGAYNEAHEYWYELAGGGDPVSFYVYDVYYPNNDASLSVDISVKLW